MLTVHRGGIILETSNLSFEKHGVFNPAIFEENGVIHLFYRAVDSNLISTIGYCKLDTPLHVSFRRSSALYKPRYRYESKGMEDPRMVKIDEQYYLSYTAFDGQNALGALMTGNDFHQLHRQGILVPLIPLEQEKRETLTCSTFSFSTPRISPKYPAFIWDKNLVFFPRRINGKLCFFHRIKPFISFVSIFELIELNRAFWDHALINESSHHLVCPSMQQSSASYVGAGCPPIETKVGWLFIYHAAYEEKNSTIYRMHILLLDLENPLKVLAELPYPILEPLMNYEQNGNVDHVVFPTGAVINGDNLYIYYGAADLCIACAYLSITELFQAFKYLSN